MRKGIGLLAAAFIVAGAVLMPQNVAAQESTIKIDGEFKDWEGIEHKDVNATNWWYEQMALTYDDKYIYLHVVESPSCTWDTRFPNLFFKVNGEIKRIVAARTHCSHADGTYRVAIRNVYCQDIPYASGRVTRSNGRNEWEIAVPIQAVLVSEGNEPSTEPKSFDATGVGLYVCACNGDIELVGVKAGTGDVTENIPDSGIPEAPDYLENGEGKDDVEDTDIVIDGYYDDWENIPATNITYGSWNYYGEYILEYHHGFLAIDDDNLYIHVEMSDTYHKQIPIDMLYLTINGETQDFIIRYEKEDGTIDWDCSVYSLSEGIHTNLGFYKNGDAVVSLGDAAITILPGHGNDSFEVAVKLEDLLKYYNIDRDELLKGAEIRFYSPNIGPEEVIIVGTSTNPFLGIAIAIGAVGIISGMGVYIKRKNAKREA